MNVLNEKLNPNFVTGFADGEACFYVRIGKKKNMKIGWIVEPVFTIRLHIKDVFVLNLIQAYFDGIGKIYSYNNLNEAFFRVGTFNELEVIVNHFDKYPLMTQKWSDFILFKEVLYLIKNKEHLTLQGLLKIANIRASMNTKTVIRGITGIVPVPRPSRDVPLHIDPFWMAGFVSGEGSFTVGLKEYKSKLGETSWLRFILTQHNRDQSLINSFVTFFGCGKINQASQATYFVVQRLSDLTNNIIPFFDRYPLVGIKVKDYEDFKHVAQLMSSKAHLTSTGLEQIRKIKNEMNTFRK